MDLGVDAHLSARAVVPAAPCRRLRRAAGRKRAPTSSPTASASPTSARVDPTGAWLYVNETCAKRISRFPVKGDKLGARETVHEFGPGEFPDGFAFDSEGGVWVACVNANRVIRIELGGRRTLILDGSIPELIAEGEAFFNADKGGRHHVELGARSPLKNIASVAFGGPDLKTVYLGNLAGDRIPTFTSPIAGAEPVQWRY